MFGIFDTKDTEPTTKNELGDIEINSRNNYDTIDTGGSALIDKGEELEQYQPEASVREDKNGEKVVELSSPGEPIGDETHTMKIDPDNPRADTFFAQEELSEIQKHNERLSEKEKDVRQRVNQHLADPNTEEDTLEALFYAKAKEERRYGWDKVEGDLSDKEKDKKFTNSLREQGIKAEFENIQNKKIQELEAGEFAQLIDEATSQNSEELSQADPQEEDTEEKPIIEELSEDTRKAAEAAFTEHGGVWSEFASELSTSSQFVDTQIEPCIVKGEAGKQITSGNPKVIAELKQAHNHPNIDSQIRKEGEGYYTFKLKSQDVKRVLN